MYIFSLYHIFRIFLLIISLYNNFFKKIDRLVINSKTWNKESYGLYDYESKTNI